MHFTDLFIRRPVLATVLSLALLLVGLQAFELLQVRQYPQINNDVVSVTTLYPGADAELIKGFITTPLQHVIATAEGIDFISAVSDEGTSTIMAYVHPESDVNIVMQEVIGKVNKLRGELPRESEDPIVEKMVNMGSDTLQYIGFYSEQMTEEQITDYLSKAVQPILSTLPGVGRAEIRGKKTFAMRVWLDSGRMSAFGVSADDVRRALSKNNFQSSAGQISGDYVLFNVSVATSLESVSGFENIVIRANSDGSIVRVKDVARVELGDHVFRYRATDGSGNASSVELQVSVIDNGVPEITVVNAPDNGWHGGNDPLSVTLDVTDGCSAGQLDVQVLPPPTDLQRDGNRITLQYEAEGVYQLRIAIEPVAQIDDAFGIDFDKLAGQCRLGQARADRGSHVGHRHRAGKFPLRPIGQRDRDHLR